MVPLMIRPEWKPTTCLAAVSAVIACAAIIAVEVHAGGAAYPAGVPDPGQSVVPSCLRLVSVPAGGLDTTDFIAFTIRDGNGDPVPGATVHLDFSGCFDVKPAAVQPYPGVNIDCPTQTISATTDGAGNVRLVVVGGVLDRSMASPRGCVEVRVDPGDVYFGTMTPSAYDQDGRDGLSALDLWLWLYDFYTMTFPPPPRSDYQCTFPYDVSAFDAVYLLRYFRDNLVDESGAHCNGSPDTVERVTTTLPVLRLGWNTCQGSGGTQTLVIPCDSNEGMLPAIVGSVVIPSSPVVSDAVAFEAIVDIVSAPGTTLPDWWHVYPGGCRYGDMLIDLDAPMGCTGFPYDPFELGTGRFFPYPHESPNVARIKIHALGALPAVPALVPGVEYALFSLYLNRASTVGPGACAGCADSVMVIFQSLDMIRLATPPVPSAGDTIVRFMRGHSTQAHVLAQGPVALDVPAPAARPGLELRLIDQSPLQGSMRIGIRSDRASAVLLDVLDVSGRLVERRIVDLSAGGERRVRLGSGRGLAAGVYVIRAVQGSRTASLKVAVLR